MTDPKQNVEPFPGGIGVTHLRVYHTPAADGLVGGSPHPQFACAEAYCGKQYRTVRELVSPAKTLESPPEMRFRAKLDLNRLKQGVRLFPRFVSDSSAPTFAPKEQT